MFLHWEVIFAFASFSVWFITLPVTGPLSLLLSLGPLDDSEKSLTMTSLLMMQAPVGIQQVKRRPWPQQPRCLGNISFWRCGSPGSPACLCLTNDGDNESEGATRNGQDSLGTSLLATCLVSLCWFSTFEALAGCLNWARAANTRTLSIARLEDRWRECFQTILLSLISAAGAPPEELQVTSAKQGSGISQNRQGLETFSLCSDWSGNLERIRFLSTHDASGCAWGGRGGRGGRVSEPFVLIVLLVLTYSMHRKVRLPRPFCLRLYWDAQADLCMTSSDLALKYILFHLYLCITWRRNRNNAYWGPRPLSCPGLWEAGIVITIIQKRKQRFRGWKHSKASQQVSQSQDLHPGLSGSKPSRHPASLGKAMIDTACWYQSVSWNQLCLKRQKQQGPNSAHFTVALRNLRTGRLAGVYWIRSQMCQILIGLYSSWPQELEKITSTSWEDFLLWEWSK